VLAKEIVFVIAGKFSRGKEIWEREYYCETIAMLILIGKRLGQSPSCKYSSSTKCKALFGLHWVFFVFVSTSIGTIKRLSFVRGGPFQGGSTGFGGEVAPNAPPGSATAQNK